MEYPESGADTATSLADPNGFHYGGRASEGELTLPRASSAAFEVPAAAYWHVHLELRPEELVALHRLGLTKGAIAWREGMPAWQPLKETGEAPRASDPGAYDIPLEMNGSNLADASAPDWSEEITVASDRELSQPVLPAIGSEPDATGHLPSRARRATLPPTSPLFAAGGRPHVQPVSAMPMRTTGSVSTFPPPPLPPPAPAPYASNGGHSPSFSTTLVGGALAPVRLPSAPPLPTFPPAQPVVSQFATQPLPSGPPPPLVFEPTGVSSPARSRNLWFGAIGLAVISALGGSLASGMLTDVRPDGAASAERSVPGDARPGQATAAQDVKAKGPEGLSPISVDQLPLAGTANAGAAKAEAPVPAAQAAVAPAPRSAVAAAPAAAAREEAESRASARESERVAASERARASERAAAEEAAAAPKSAVLAAIAAAAGAPAPESPAPPSAAEESAPAEPASSGGAADLKAIAKAVSAAARAATSCGESPQSGKVAITFSPSGAVRSVQMEEPFGERDVGSCVLRAMGRAKVSAFTGDPVVVKKSVTW